MSERDRRPEILCRHRHNRSKPCGRCEELVREMPDDESGTGHRHCRLCGFAHNSALASAFCEIEHDALSEFGRYTLRGGRTAAQERAEASS